MGLGALGVSLFAGTASAHDLTGGSAQATCSAGSVTVSWTFTSANAGDHTIQVVTFDRPVSSSSHTTDTVSATTHETPGTSVELRATVTFEDGFQSSHTVTTTIPNTICPSPSTSVPPTTVPPTTVPPTTVPPTTVPPTTVPPTTAPPTTAPAPSTTAPVPTVEPKVDVTPPAQAPPTTAHPVTALPTTGSTSTAVLVAGLGSLLVGGALLVAGRRPKEA
jgi:LPXTG-motif cell wall-anchored protein